MAIEIRRYQIPSYNSGDFSHMISTKEGWTPISVAIEGLATYIYAVVDTAASDASKEIFFFRTGDDFDFGNTQTVAFLGTVVGIPLLGTAAHFYWNNG